MDDPRTVATGYSPSAHGDEVLAPGTVIENFRIECTLGRGGMSTVYGAVHTVIGKRGAIKVLKRELCTDQKEVGRFVQEARAVNQIGHANIVDVFAFGELPDGRSYLIMEWLVGQSLRARMGRGPLSRNDVREIILDVVRALEATHAKQIIHRDLKPDNVFLVDTPGEKPRAKLLDFGVAKLTGEGRHDRTKIGSMLGTPQYLAPEQARGEPDHRSDIYALGCLLFEMIAGRPPFIGENAIDVVSMHMTEPAPKLSACAKGVPPELDALVDAMLAKEPADRPTLAHVRSEVESLLATRPGKKTQPTTRKRTPLMFVIAGLAAALALVIVIFVVRASGDEATEETKEQPREARREERRQAKLEARAERQQAKQQRRAAPTVEAPPPAPETGKLVIEWAGSADVRFTVDGAAVWPHEPLALAPGAHKVVTLRNNKMERTEVRILAGKTTRLPIKPATRAPSRRIDDSLNPLNNAPR